MWQWLTPWEWFGFLVCGLLGYLNERIAYRPLRNQPRIASLITAIGVSFLLEYGGQVVAEGTPEQVVASAGSSGGGSSDKKEDDGSGYDY